VLVIALRSLARIFHAPDPEGGFRVSSQILDESSLPVAKSPPRRRQSFMQDNSQRREPTSVSAHRDPFLPGSMVVVTLGNPRDKFWGMILSLSREGLSLSGVELASFEDLVVMVKDGESFSPAIVFFPMHRIERVELDLPDGNLPSLSQRFSAKTGFDPATMLGSPLADSPAVSAVRSANVSQKEPA
jgi:hypothetical protein